MHQSATEFFYSSTFPTFYKADEDRTMNTHDHFSTIQYIIPSFRFLLCFISKNISTTSFNLTA
jgi:hypothetical protein